MNELINQFIYRNSKRKVKIAVVGDSMLDEYYFVDANRVSPEFPIPVLQSPDTTPKVIVPGGAGNVACQFKDWNVDLQLFSLLDGETNGILMENEIDTRHSVFPAKGFHCPIKRRFYQGQFPLCRWDIEEPNGGVDIDSAREWLCKNFKSTKPEVAIFSDYNKGVFVKKRQDWFYEDEIQEGTIITIVDPKKGPIDAWKGCTIFKPNQVEAEVLSGGIKDWKNQCNFFQRIVGCMAVVITQGKDGVVGKVGGTFFEYRPEITKQCQSVIGGGDCFSAFLAMTMAHNFDIVDAVKIAYEAGSVYVLNRHNQPVSPYDLQKHIDPIKAKYVTSEFLRNRPTDHNLIFTNGCFDLLHEGHIQLLRQAKALGGQLVVAVNSDDSVRRLKGESRPIQDLQERMVILSSLEFVDYVVSFKEDTPLELIKNIKPNVIVKGGDYKPEEVVGYGEMVFGGMVKVVVLPLLPGKSTSIKINKIIAK